MEENTAVLLLSGAAGGAILSGLVQYVIGAVQHKRDREVVREDRRLLAYTTFLGEFGNALARLVEAHEQERFLDEYIAISGVAFTSEFSLYAPPDVLKAMKRMSNAMEPFLAAVNPLQEGDSLAGPAMVAAWQRYVECPLDDVVTAMRRDLGSTIPD